MHSSPLTSLIAGEQQRDRRTIATAGRARSRRRRGVLGAVVPLALAAAALPSAADASFAGVDPTNRVLHYVDGSSEKNDIGLTVGAGGQLRLTDTAAIGKLFTNSECRLDGTRIMLCNPGNVSRVVVHLGFGDDSYVGTHSLPAEVNGGPGSDTYFGGVALGRSLATFNGGEGFDIATYGPSATGVTVRKDLVPNDGRTGKDGDNIGADVERLIGSSHADTIVGGASPVEHLIGQGGDDVLDGGAGRDVFMMGATADGADRLFGGGDEDTVLYAERTRPVRVNLSDGGADDGEAGERDELRQIEGARGGSAGDVLRAHPDGTTPVTLLGLDGADTITGARGGDTINGGRGIDRIDAAGGNDVIQARDGEADTVACGTEFDTADVENGLDLFSGCERFERIGVLRLAARDAAAGRPARVDVAWAHPRAWKALRSVRVDVLDRGVTVGSAAVDLRRRALTGDGAVRVLRAASSLATEGRTASAKLALKVDAALAGRRLQLQVEAIDRQGRRQVERRAGTIRVAG
jgi:hypothetical protein